MFKKAYNTGQHKGYSKQRPIESLTQTNGTSKAHHSSRVRGRHSTRSVQLPHIPPIFFVPVHQPNQMFLMSRKDTTVLSFFICGGCTNKMGTWKIMEHVHSTVLLITAICQISPFHPPQAHNSKHMSSPFTQQSVLKLCRQILGSTLTTIQSQWEAYAISFLNIVPKVRLFQRWKLAYDWCKLYAIRVWTSHIVLYMHRLEKRCNFHICFDTQMWHPTSITLE